MCAPEPCGETMQNKMPPRSLWQKLLKERKENTAQHMYEANVCCFVSSLLKGKTNFEMALKKGERHMGRDSESHKLHVSLIAIKYSKYVAGSTARTSKHVNTHNLIRWLLCRRTTVKIDLKLEKHGNKHWKYDLIVCVCHEHWSGEVSSLSSFSTREKACTSRHRAKGVKHINIHTSASAITNISTMHK